jgi:hypothetical protein
MATSSERFEPYVGDEEEWKDYLEKMSNSKAWGDELTLRAISDAYGIHIHVITTENQNWHLLY